AVRHLAHGHAALRRAAAPAEAVRRRRGGEQGAGHQGADGAPQVQAGVAALRPYRPPACLPAGASLSGTGNTNRPPPCSAWTSHPDLSRSNAFLIVLRDRPYSASISVIDGMRLPTSISPAAMRRRMMSAS